MTVIHQRRAEKEKEGMIMIKMIRMLSMARVLNRREKEELITINLIRNLNIRGMTLLLKANHLTKVKNVLEGVMIHLI